MKLNKYQIWVGRVLMLILRIVTPIGPYSDSIKYQYKKLCKEFEDMENETENSN